MSRRLRAASSCSRIAAGAPFAALAVLAALPCLPAQEPRGPVPNDLLATLERLRTQCPDPARARLNEYGAVEGPSNAAPGILLSGWVTTERDEGGLRIRHCSVNARNGESVEQCWPLKADCRQAPLWTSGD